MALVGAQNGGFYTMDNQVEGPIFRPEAAAAYLGLSKSAFYRLVKAGKICQPLRIGAGTSGHPKTMLDDFISRLAADQGAVA